MEPLKVFVDVIVPVHNAAATIEETVSSAMEQTVPSFLIKLKGDTDAGSLQDMGISDTYERYPLDHVSIDVAVCCQDDASSDDSLTILRRLETKYNATTCGAKSKIFSSLVLGWNKDGASRGAGWARNRATFLREKKCSGSEWRCIEESLYFLCLLDSDDIMHPHRIAHQVSVMLALSPPERNATLLGSTFRRIPADSTWHYTRWANSLSDKRLILERYREITVLQPTWMMTKKRFQELGHYVETSEINDSKKASTAYRLIHPEFDTQDSLRLAEDLRLFHAHLSFPFSHDEKRQPCGEQDGVYNLKGALKLIRTNPPLLAYRHRAGQSQSSSTSRKLLLQLRVKAFVDTIVRSQKGSKENTSNHSLVRWTDGFIIWGAGRDGKDFFKALPNDIKRLVKAFADIDEKKIASGYYVAPTSTHKKDGVTNSNADQAIHTHPKKRGDKVLIRRNAGCHIRIPIVHFSLLVKDEVKRKKMTHAWINREDEGNHGLDGRITKERPQTFCQSQPQQLSQKRSKNDIYNGAYANENESNKTNKRAKLDVLTKRKLHTIAKKDMENTSLIPSLAKLPVVVCVAMYRTNGVLEKNVASIGRTEGSDLWHFS